MSIADHAAAAHSGIHLIRADGVFAAATASIMPCCVGGREGGKGSDTIAKSNNYNFDRSDGQLSEIRNSTLDHTVCTCFVPRRGSLWCVTKQIFDSDHVACNLHCGLAKLQRILRFRLHARTTKFPKRQHPATLVPLTTLTPCRADQRCCMSHVVTPILSN